MTAIAPSPAGSGRAASSIFDGMMLFAHTTDIVFVLDGEHRLVQLNPAAERVLGWTNLEALGRPISDFVVPEHHGRLRALHDSAASGHAEMEAEFDLQSRHGGLVTLHAKVVPLLREGQVVGYEGIARDVTAARAEADRMRRMLDARNQFIEALSHQLRTPLTIIKWSMEIAGDQPGLPAEARSLVQSARDSSSSLIRLINDLLDTARQDMVPARSTDPRQTDLTMLTWRTLRDLGPVARARSIDLTVGHITGETTVVADATLLLQTLQNVVVSGLERTPRGGRLRITIRGESERVIWSLSDTSLSGSPLAATPREQSGTPHAENLLHQLVQWLGGRIVVEASAGIGITVSVALPRSAPDAA